MNTNPRNASMKNIRMSATLWALTTLLLVGLATLLYHPEEAHAQVQPGQFVQTAQVCTTSGTTGTFTATPAPDATQTYEIAGSVGTGTGTLTIAVEGHIVSSTWSTIGTTTLALTPTSSVGIITNTTRFAQVRCNITALSGTTPTATVTMGF